MPVANADAPILAMLLPSSSAPINRSRIANRLETTSASRLPCFDSRSMLARDAPISAVSLAAKNADTKRQTMTIENAIQSMMCNHFICGWSMIFSENRLHFALTQARWVELRSNPILNLTRQLGFQKIANQRRLDVVGNHGASDCLKQDEGEPAALDLLVLAHQRHQRVGIRKALLGKSCDILQMGR